MLNPCEPGNGSFPPPLAQLHWWASLVGPSPGYVRAVGLAAVGLLGLSSEPRMPFCLLHLVARDSQTPALPDCTWAGWTRRGWWGGRGPRGNACCCPGPRPQALLTGAISWPLGPGSLQWREQRDCKCRSIQLVTSLWVHPPLCPVVPRHERTLGFLRRRSLSTRWLSPGAPAVSSLGLILGRCSYTKQVGPQNFLLSVETSSGAGGEAPGQPIVTPLPESLALPTLRTLCLSPRGQATREPGLWHSRGSGGQLGRLWPNSQDSLSNWTQRAIRTWGRGSA